MVKLLELFTKLLPLLVFFTNKLMPAVSFHLLPVVGVLTNHKLNDW